ncbi:hypothetical protein [Pedobacter sp. N23S346]|uniref:hypothetical protein n=1 Tax=Pedobacter sp. N23S346 TaxID=3402750 RepID=UPI003AD385A6
MLFNIDSLLDLDRKSDGSVISAQQILTYDEILKVHISRQMHGVSDSTISSSRDIKILQVKENFLANIILKYFGKSSDVNIILTEFLFRHLIDRVESNWTISNSDRQIEVNVSFDLAKLNSYLIDTFGSCPGISKYDEPLKDDEFYDNSKSSNCIKALILIGKSQNAN